MKPDEDPPPETENPRLVTEGSNEDFRLIYNPRGFALQAQQCRDCWIEGYLLHLEDLNVQFGDGPACTHTIRVAMRLYEAFRFSCDPLHRLATWEAIKASCRVFCRLSRRN